MRRRVNTFISSVTIAVAAAVMLSYVGASTGQRATAATPRSSTETPTATAARATSATTKTITTMKTTTKTTTTTTTASSTTATNRVRSATTSSTSPVYVADFPDPFVLPTSDGYVAFSTNSGGSNVPAITSTDLVHWRSVGDALPHLPSWAGRSGTWAPSVIKISDTYVMYLTVRDTRRGLECIVTAESASATGPYTVTSDEPLVCAPKGSIDASVLRTDDGQLWLTWKNEAVGNQPAEIVSARLRVDGLALTGPQTVLVRANLGWEGGNVEGPSLTETARGYILFFSSGSWRSSGYSTGYATCATPAGACTVSKGKWLSSADGLDGPGGLQVFRSSNGTTYAAFHTWQPCTDCAQWRRELNIRRIDITSAIPTFE